jgi:two-component system NtrC family sensor kinase
MGGQRDVILIVDDDPEERALLRDQVFSSDQFEVIEAQDGPTGLIHLRQYSPDLIVLDLQLPSLTGRDMLVAIQSQGYHGPLIVIADSSSERGVIEAFRLGATDYITRPIRETEVLAAVERGLAEVRLRRQRDTLVMQVQETNRQLEARLNELTTLYDIGQSVSALRELESLFEGVMEGAISVTGADHAMLLLRDDETGQLILRAGKNMRLAMLDRLGESVQDPLADLVMTSREALTVAGDSLHRFTAAKDLYAAAYAPLIVQTMSIGVLVVGNHEKQAAFTENHGRLLKALADYAAIAIVNAHLFTMLEQRARAVETAYRELQAHDAERGRQMQIVLARLHQPLAGIEHELARLARGDEGKIPKNVGDRLSDINQQVRQLASMIAGLVQRQ